MQLKEERDPCEQQSRTTRIGFVLLPGFALMSYAACIEPLRAANVITKRTLFSWAHLATSPAPVVSSSGAQIAIDCVVSAKDAASEVSFDYIFICAGGTPFCVDDEVLFAWLRMLDRKGATLGGVSGGTAILARAGVLRRRRATIHWEHAATFREFFPQIHLERSLFVMDRDRITCAGGMAPLDMMSALISNAHGKVLASQVSDWFLQPRIRLAGEGQRAGSEVIHRITSKPLLAAIEYMQNHIADPGRLEDIAAYADLSPRQLTRLFKAHLNKGAVAFYRDLRLEHAKSLLRQSTLSLADIAVETGFSSGPHLNKLFQQHFDITPIAFRNRF